MKVLPATADRLGDLAGLFGSSGTTRGCYCMFFLTSNKAFGAGWGPRNRADFESFAVVADPPAGLLAYRNGEPVGWCATGPRSRYPRALRSIVLKGRAVEEDDNVWLVPCFFVRRDARRSGVSAALLRAAIARAQEYGAPAIEGFPLAGGHRHPSGEAYVGVEPFFAACGFIPVAHPTPRRVVMRHDLRPPASDVNRRPTSDQGRGGRTGRS